MYTLKTDNPDVVVVNRTEHTTRTRAVQGFIFTKMVEEPHVDMYCEVILRFESQGRYFEPCIESISLGRYIGHRSSTEREGIRKEYIDWLKRAQ